MAETQISKELAKEITGSENTHKGWAQARAEQAAAEATAKAAAIEKETNELIEMLEEKLAASQTSVIEIPPVPATPVATPPVPPAQVQAEELTEHPENCSQCGSHDIRRFYYHDPKEHYFYCRDCGHEGWRHEKLPPAQVEELEVEDEEVDAITTECCDNDPCIDCDDYCDCSESESDDTESEVMEVPPVEVEKLEDAIAKPAEGIAQPVNQAEEIENFEDTPPWYGRSNNEIFRGLEYYSIEEYEELKNSNDPLNQDYYKTNYRGWKIEINPYDIFITRLADNKQFSCGIYEDWEEKLWIAKDHIDLIELIEVEKLSDAIAMSAEGIVQIVESRLKKFPPVKWQIPELPPIPRDFSELEQLPEWWERPILPDFRECSCGEPYDDDDDLDWVQETYGVNATYRGWKLTIYEGGDQIYATPPSGDRTYHCECELDLDGQDGQIALAQEFIDSWYFAQPSPGQLSLNIPEVVARDPPPRFG